MSSALPRMRFEHFALNVPDAPAHTAWYTRYLGLEIVSQKAKSPFTHFLADETGRVDTRAQTADGAIMQFWTNNSSFNQQWRFVQ